MLISDNSQRVSPLDGFTYNAAGAINSMLPINGQQGTAVTIEGVDAFGHGNSITFLADGEVTEIVESTNTKVIVIAALAPESVGDIVLVSDSGATMVLADGTARNELVDGLWTYDPVAVIESVSPGFGQLDTTVAISGTGLRSGASEVVSVTLSTIEVAEIVTESDTEVVVIATGEKPGHLCDVVCHGSCEACSGPGVNECTGCIDGNVLWKGACVPPCDADQYRFSDGNGHVDAIVSLPGIFQSIFDESEIADFEAIVASAVGIELANDGGEAVPVAAAIVATTKDTAPTGLTLNVTFTANQASYESFEQAVHDAITSGRMLAALKKDGKAYQYVDEISTSASSLYTGSMCQACDPKCNGCIGGPSDECSTCADGYLRLERACIETCSDGFFHDINDDLCKPVACEYGDVVGTADTGGWVVSEDSCGRGDHIRRAVLGPPQHGNHD